MFIIHTHVGKRKKKNPNAKERQLKAEWDALVEKYKSTPKKVPKVVIKQDNSPYIRQTEKIPSLGNGIGNATMPKQKVYTGTCVKGIATMHKSNAVPVFSSEEAVDISKMRR